MEPGAALIVGLAVAIDNVSEAMSIGELIASEGKKDARRQTLLWTAVIGVSLFVSSMAGWFFLRNVPEAVQGALFAMGAGGMFYLTMTDLVPEAEAHQFQESSAISIGVGFVAIMVLSELL